MSSFGTLNHQWRLGPLFQPVRMVSFSFPYDGEDRTRCLQLALKFFRSLAPDVQHIEHVYLGLGIIWDAVNAPPNIDYALLGSLLREVHRSGSRRLTLASIDISGQVGRPEPASDILLDACEEHPRLHDLSLETIAFSSPALTPWFMGQLTKGSSISRLRLTGTGFSAAQLDSIMCYFDLPQLQYLAIGDAWLVTVVELLRGCPRLETIQFLELSPDLRVPCDMFVSLRALRHIHGNATVVRSFLPLLRDVAWDSFQEINIDTTRTNGPDDVPEHSFDCESCIKALWFLVQTKAEVQALAITFPPLADFSLDLFEASPEVVEIMNRILISRLRIQLYCNTECENGALMVSTYRINLRSAALIAEP